MLTHYHYYWSALPPGLYAYIKRSHTHLKYLVVNVRVRLIMETHRHHKQESLNIYICVCVCVCVCARPQYWETFKLCNCNAFFTSNMHLLNHNSRATVVGNMKATPMGTVVGNMKATPMGTGNNNWCCL